MNSKKIKSYFSIIRPINVLITFIACSTAYYISSGRDLMTMIIGSLSPCLILAAGNIINDYYDIEIDMINKPEKACLLLSKKEMLICYCILSTLGLAVSFSLSNINLALAIAAIILLFLYSSKLKKILYINNIVVAGLTGLVMIYGGAVNYNIKPVIIPAVFAFMVNYIREIIKDWQDVSGDKQYGVNTIPIIFDELLTKIIVGNLIILLIVITFIPFIYEFYNINYILLINILVNPLLSYSLKILTQEINLNNLHKISNLLKFAMLTGIAAIIAGQ